ncbi:serine/arginine repetitive matrix protein, partial [Trifolium pratense]
GTSADQDTRFSNKQAKLLKSQKFAPELEHLVDTTKVNMEVMKPWITRKVTELLGFEDEVLINFIHGLLEAKIVNGKEVQIQITGFMEKNTVKFMKELWTLLLSAQKNASGVPQQFLDAKEEELLKKKAEHDRITSEIQRKKDKESKEIREERLKKLDGGLDAKDNDTASDPALKPRDSGNYIQDGKETDKRNGVKARNSPSWPHVGFLGPHIHLQFPPHLIEVYLQGQGQTVNHFRIPEVIQGVYPDLQRLEDVPFLPEGYNVLHGNSLFLLEGALHNDLLIGGLLIQGEDQDLPQTPNLLLYDVECILHFVDAEHPLLLKDVDPPLQCDDVDRPLQFDDVDHPLQYDDTDHHPLQYDDADHHPLQYDAADHLILCDDADLPLLYDAADHLLLCDDPNHLLQCTYVDHRHLLDKEGHPHPCNRDLLASGVGHLHRCAEYHQAVGVGQALQCNLPQCEGMIVELRGAGLPLPCGIDHLFLARKDLQVPPLRGLLLEMNGVLSLLYVYLHPQPGEFHQDTKEVLCSLLWEESAGDTPHVAGCKRRVQKKLSPEVYQPSSPLQSVQRDKNGKASGYKSPDSMSTPDKSPIRSISPQARSRTSIKNRSPREIPLRQTRENLTKEGSLSPPKKPTNHKPRHGIPETSEGAEEAYYSRERRDPKSNSSEKKSRHPSPVSKRIGSSAKFHHEDEFYPERAASHEDDNNKWSKKGQDIKCDKSSGKGGESPVQQKSPMNKEFVSSEKPHDSYAAEIKKSDDKDQSISKYAKSSDQHKKSEAAQDLVEKADHVNQSASCDSGSEESGKHRRDGKDRRKHKRSERKVDSSDENDSYDSELEDRKEAKRRKKEEKKKLRKEEKHRKREERRRKREERHAEKLKMKSKTDYISDDEEVERRDDEEAPYDPKKLEIELRNKALESLKAKKGMNN